MKFICSLKKNISYGTSLLDQINHTELLVSLNEKRRVLLNELPLLVEGEPAEIWLQPREVPEEASQAHQVVLEKLPGAQFNRKILGLKIT